MYVPLVNIEDGRSSYVETLTRPMGMASMGRNGMVPSIGMVSPRGFLVKEYALRNGITSQSSGKHPNSLCMTFPTEGAFSNPPFG
jgi:hypothetical protein